MSTWLSLLVSRRVWSVALKTALVLLVAPATIAAKQVLMRPEPARWTIPQADRSFGAALRAATSADVGRDEKATPSAASPRRAGRSTPLVSGAAATVATPRATRRAVARVVGRNGTWTPTRRTAPLVRAPALPRPEPKAEDPVEDDDKSGDRGERRGERPGDDDGARPTPPEVPPVSEEPPEPAEPDDDGAEPDD